jgi:transcriptional regulator with XRE-family HTH domain
MMKMLSIAIPETAALMANILGAQMRAARALLRWSAADLVRESGVSMATIHRAESVDGITAMTLANATAIRRALENAGVELIEENGGGLGARLKQRLEPEENSDGPGVRLDKFAKEKPRK